MNASHLHNMQFDVADSHLYNEVQRSSFPASSWLETADWSVVSWCSSWPKNFDCRLI